MLTVPMPHIMSTKRRDNDGHPQSQSSPLASIQLNVMVVTHASLGNDEREHFRARKLPL